MGNARLQGLAKDVLGGDPTGKRFDWVNSIFFLSYVRSHIPMQNISKSHGGLWLDFMHGPSDPPCQTPPPSTLVGLGGYRLGYLLHPHGWSLALLLSTEGQQSHLSGSPMQSTATNQAGLMAARIGLGVFEAAFGPGIPLYFSRHY